MQVNTLKVFLKDGPAGSDSAVRSSPGGGVRTRLYRAAVRAWPLLLACVCFLLCFLYGGMQYQTNDDYSIQVTLAGNTTGTPFPVHQFISAFIGYPISWLYSVFSSVQWWYVYSQCLIFVSLVIVNWSLDRTVRHKGLPVAFGVLFAVIADAVFFLYSIANITFTVVGGITGTAAVMLILISRDSPRKLRYYIPAAILFVLTVCHRESSGLLVYCYMLAALFCVLIGLDMTLIKRFLGFLSAAVFLFALMQGLILGNQAIQADTHGREFAAFNSARSRFMDYPKDTYSENPQLYEELGWSELVYRLASSWCFLPDEITTENFTAAVARSTKEARTFDPETLGDRWASTWKDERVVYTGIVCLVTALGALVMTVMARDRKMLLAELINIAGTVILIVYQLVGGRSNYRSLVICFLPSAMISLYLMLNGIGTGRPFRGRGLVIAALVAVLCVPGSVRGVANSLVEANREGSLREAALEQALYDHVIGHPDNIYIRVNTTTMKSPLPICPDEKPSNLFNWGGSTFYSASFRKQLEINGLTKLNGDVLRRDNVYVVSATDLEALAEGKKTNKGSLALLYAWQKTEHGAVCISLEDTVSESLYIYRIRYDDSRPDETQIGQGRYYDYTGSKFFRYTGVTEEPDPFDGLARKPVEYLGRLNNDDYISVIAVSKDAACYLPGPVNDQMVSMGLIPLKGRADQPYIAVLNGGRIVYNEAGVSSGELSAECEIDGISLSVISRTRGKYQASVIIGGEEYSKRLKGMIVFVYSRSEKAMVDIRGFTWSTINYVTSTDYSKITGIDELIRAADKDGCDVILLCGGTAGEEDENTRQKYAGILNKYGFNVDRADCFAGVLLPDGTVYQTGDREQAALDVDDGARHYTLMAGKDGCRMDFGSIEYRSADHNACIVIYRPEEDAVLALKNFD